MSAPSKRRQLTKLNLPKLAGRKASSYLRTQLVQIYQFKIFQFTYNHSESTSTKIKFWELNTTPTLVQVKYVSNQHYLPVVTSYWTKSLSTFDHKAWSLDSVNHA